MAIFPCKQLCYWAGLYRGAGNLMHIIQYIFLSDECAYAIYPSEYYH
ncbi:MAG: hypothetical protein RL368_669 [Pseudomonadota bacterium]|jgi:hypothetical protein